VLHFGIVAIYIKKYLKAKEEFMKAQILYNESKYNILVLIVKANKPTLLQTLNPSAAASIGKKKPPLLQLTYIHLLQSTSIGTKPTITSNPKPTLVLHPLGPMLFPFAHCTQQHIGYNSQGLYLHV
jgi:hypothetical protein